MGGGLSVSCIIVLIHMHRFVHDQASLGAQWQGVGSPNCPLFTHTQQEGECVL